jgi:hypothetical protein
MGYKNKFNNSSPFALLIINIKISSNFKKEWCVGLKKDIGKNKDYPLSKFECFEHTKTFLICVKL